jgi:hypothetical protein
MDAKINMLCTLSDYKYIHQGLALFDSIKDENIKLYYLALDEKTYKKLIEINNKKLIPVFIDDLLINPKLQKLKDESYQYFCWSLASYFCQYLMEKLNCDITYLDSDIFFHLSINNIFSEFGNKDIGIFRHRHHPPNRFTADGYFNVGVVHFKNSKIAKDVLDWWVDSVLDKKFPFLTTCGDQKYLDLFPILCSPDKIFIDGNIGHGAPWHWQLYNFKKYTTDKKIIWENTEQKLVFSHFSKFYFDIEKNIFIPSTLYYQFTPLQTYYDKKELLEIYSDYFKIIKKVSLEYEL